VSTKEYEEKEINKTFEGMRTREKLKELEEEIRKYNMICKIQKYF